MANKKIMTKEELQAKHRLEEAQMRDRAKERKARTRRLIQEGAVLEKVFPEAQQMELEKLEDLLYEKLHFDGWTFRDSNPGPAGYEPAALTSCAKGPYAKRHCELAVPLMGGGC